MVKQILPLRASGSHYQRMTPRNLSPSPLCLTLKITPLAPLRNRYLSKKINKNYCAILVAVTIMSIKFIVTVFFNNQNSSAPCLHPAKAHPMTLFLSALPAAAFTSRPSEKLRVLRGCPYNGHQAVSPRSIPASVSSSLQQKTTPIVRRQSNFHPTVWDDCFFESLTTYDAAYVASTTQRIDKLKEKVHYMFLHANNPLQMMNLVDTIERLGLAYHFEKGIQSALQQLYEEYSDINDSLHDVALRFRMLRQEGYDVSCDVFDKFKDSDGKLKQNLINDVRGLLSLYEASHLSIHGEDILDEALTFTTKHLKSLCTYCDPSLARHVEHALELPLHKSAPILNTRYFISYYETSEAKNNVLLELAKLDFNLLQSCHRGEIKEVAKWRKDIDFTGKFPFARDRLVELYIWAVQIIFLPQFSEGRIALAKYVYVFTIIDDIYDLYGTMDELQLYTDAFNRWDLAAMDQLPDYMKLSYLLICNLFNEVEFMSFKYRRSSSIYYLRKLFGDVCTSYLQEARWFYDGYVPSMDEYLKIARITTHFFVTTTIGGLGMGDLITNEDLDYMLEGSKLPRFVPQITRLLDDLAPSKDEREKGIVALSIKSYTKEHGVSEEVAEKHMKDWVAEAWKGINQELLRKPSHLPKPLVKAMLNTARLSEDIFMNGNDGLGDSDGWMMDLLNSLFFEPIPM